MDSSRSLSRPSSRAPWGVAMWKPRNREKGRFPREDAFVVAIVGSLRPEAAHPAPGEKNWGRIASPNGSPRPHPLNSTRAVAQKKLSLSVRQLRSELPICVSLDGAQHAEPDAEAPSVFIASGCNTCGSKCAPYECSRCCAVSYCSEQCQRVGWRTHKAVCSHPTS